jgi:phosphatidylglycerophosphatase C
LSFGTPARPLAAALVRYVDTVLAMRGNAAALAAFASHLARGDRVLVATAAPPLIVRRFLRAKGLPAVSVVGTRLLRRSGGLVARPHCIGQTKVVELERRHGLTEWAEVYSDSALDLPILLRARAVTLVEPSASGRARVERALAKGVSLRVL